MSEETLGQIADLLENALKIHKSVRTVVLCTREGVVVASVSKEKDDDPQMLSTVAAALSWAGTTTLEHIGAMKPSYWMHSTPDKQILSMVQEHYQLVVVLTAKESEDSIAERIMPQFQSMAMRVELIMSSSETFQGETILDKIVKAIPSIGKAMLLTLEGLPISSVGFDEYIEVAALASSIFANGLTLSSETDTIVVGSEETKLVLARVDDKRIVAVVCTGPDIGRVCREIRSVV